MKKALSLFLAGLMVASLSACGNNAEPQPATDENKTVADQSDMAAPQEIEESTPVYADVLNDGTYDITVESSSSMFNIEACQLTVADGKMTAAMTMGGTGYLYVFPGTGEEAAAASEDQYISFEENDAGQHVFTIPVEYLDKGVDCAAFSKNKEMWYDRTLVFQSVSLPQQAWKESPLKTVADLSLADGTYQVNGQKVLIPFIYKSTDNMMIQALQQQGAGYARADGTVELWNEDTKEILKTVAQHTATGAFSTFKISSYPANFFNAGQCIFAIDSTAGATWVGTHAPLLDISADTLVDFETAVLPIPQYHVDAPKMISQGPSICLFYKEDPQEVLASWLFAQFLLTTDVQLGYAETEGYVPVTGDARESADYFDYLSRAGEDNDAHYDVKIKASQLLLDHLEDTFVTPVFNGSASVRLAAGQLIEDTAKAVRRKQDTSDKGLEKIYENVSALYRLDAIAVTPGTSELGPLPTEAKMLLWALGLSWAGLAAAFLRQRKRKS